MTSQHIPEAGMKSASLLALLYALPLGTGATFAANVISATPDHVFDVNSIPPPGLQGYVFYATGATAGHNVSSSTAIGLSTGTLGRAPRMGEEAE
jgi:hypothetical protein